MRKIYFCFFRMKTDIRLLKSKILALEKSIFAIKPLEKVFLGENLTFLEVEYWFSRSKKF